MAKKFVFSLEPLLKLRRYNVEMKKIALADIVRLREEQDKLIKDKNYYLEQITGTDYNNKSAAGAMQAIYSHRDCIKYEIVELEKKKEQLVEIERLRQIEYTDAKKEVKALEKLKEGQLNEYKFQAGREEAITLDEIALRKKYFSK